MSRDPYEVLFLCTGNSARSIIAECVLNRLGEGRFRAHSAGSTPTGRVNPAALRLLEGLGYPTARLRSKSWDEFAAEGAPELDFIITVCDNAAGEVCPIWPGKPMSIHWGAPDPAAVEGDASAIDRAFAEMHRLLQHRIERFVNLPVETLDARSLRRRLDEIGQTRDAPEPA
jgi:protein-tyrosine-phosphatase